MSRRGKLEKFADNQAAKNVIEPGKEIYSTIKGGWKSFFGNDNPIVLEIGCGKGDYTIGLAERFPDKNYIGVDIKGARIWVGSQRICKIGEKTNAIRNARYYFLEF